MKGLYLLPWLLLAPMPAFALDMDFYTYDGFQETVDAFTRLALVMSDSGFTGFAFTFAIAGIVMGGLFFAAKAHMGQANNPIGWFIPILFGMCIYKGLVMPTGTMYIYDPVINANQAVGGVPDIVTFLAGGLNELERDIVTVVDTGSANPYGNTGGMIQFNLLMASMGSQPDDVDLGRSIAQYYTDCGTFSIGTNYQGVSVQELMRTSQDLYTTFAKFANPALYTTYYADTNDQGTTMTCAADWTNNLSPLLSSTSQPGMQTMENEICGKAGFNVTQSAQVAACDTQIATIPALLGVTGGSSLSFLRSVALAQSITTAMQSGQYSLAQSQIMNRQVMVESMGSAQAMNEWIPKLRAFMTALVVGLLPLCCLFLMTPLAWKAFALIAGLFFWLFFWGISDAIASQMANDAAVNAFAQIAHYNLGFDAIINSPEGAVKALGIFGKARGMALTVSTVLSGGLMAFGGLGLSNLSQNWQKDVESKGENAGRTAYLPENRGAFMDSVASGVAKEANIDRNGMANVAGGQLMSMNRSAASFRELSVNRSLAGDSGPMGLSDTMGAIEAGRMSGEASGTVSATKAGMKASSDNVADAFRSPSGSDVASYAAGASQFETTNRYGGVDGQRQSLESKGLTSYEGGYFDGGKRISDQGAFREVYKNVNPDLVDKQTGKVNITPEGLQKMSDLTTGSVIGQSESTPNPRSYIEQQKQFADKMQGAARYLEQHPGKADSAGFYSQMRDIVHTDGFKAAASTMGVKSLTRGAELGEEQTGAYGDAAAQAAGSTAAFARGTAPADAGQKLGNSRAAAVIANWSGMDGKTVGGLVHSFTNRGLTQVPIELNSTNGPQILSRMVADKQITQEKADEVTKSGFGGTVIATIGEDGKTVSSDLKVGRSDAITDSSTVSNVDMHTSETGARKDFYNTDARHYENSPTGAIGLFTKNNLGRELASAYKGTGYDKDQVRMTGVAEAFGRGMEQMGVNVSSQQAYDVLRAARIGASAQGSVGAGIGKGGPVSASAALGISGGVDKTWQERSGTSTTVNGNTVLAEAAFDAVRETAINDVWRQHGEVFMKDPGNQAEASRLVAERQAELAIPRVMQLAATAKGLTADTLQSNDVVQKQIYDDDVARTPPAVRQEMEVEKLRSEPKF